MLEEKREYSSDEPQEVVSWYIPRAKEGEEIVCYYVQSKELPEKARAAAPVERKKRSRRGFWIFLACIAVLTAAVIVTVIVWGNKEVEPPRHDPDTEGNGASIVDIYATDGTDIPVVEGDPNVRLQVQTSHGEELTPQEVYAKVNPAVVTVVANGAQGSFVGTGVIMTEDGYIVTNAHLLYGTESCWIALHNNYTFDAYLVGYDEEEDLAVLKAVDASGLPVAEFGDSNEAVVGDTVYAIGNPLGMELRGTFTDGIISAVNRDVEMDGRMLTLLQTNAALNNGNSGGPLINRYGQVIGINVMKISGSGGKNTATVEGLSFALPISDMAFVVNDIIACGYYRGMPMLGIMVQTYVLEDGGTAVVVVDVTPDAAADVAGVQVGDVILAADGVPVSVNNDLLTVRRSHAVGDTMVLTVQRDQQVLELEVVLRSDRH